MFKRVTGFSVFFVFTATLLAIAVEKRYDVPIGDSPSLGPENAPITIIKFLDYQ
jgi:hypothetical protein